MLLTLLERQVVFFGGKGGVGKTTCSSAFALAASRRGRRVLLVSTDPAHSTSDIFDREIGPDEREIEPNLCAVEIDPVRESERYVGSVKRDIERMFSPAVIRQAHRQIDLASASPGLADVALLDRMIDVVVERGARYDLIVFDTAPTGHTVQLLRTPEVMETWIQALVRHRRALLEIDRGGEAQGGSPPLASDPVLAALERRHERLKLLRACVLDRSTTSFVLVTIPERLAIEETCRAREQLASIGIDVGALIVNRILPDDVDGAFYRARKTQESRYLEEIVTRFPRVRRVDVRQLPQDVYGLATLTRISDQLVG
jgi:arsenite/tail-anchored protein-transporting ATPase